MGQDFGLWPPEDPIAYFNSDAFGNLALDTTKALIRKHPALDFSDAIAVVFEWLQRRSKQQPAFLSAGNFPTFKAFVAYLRQALLNAARMTLRARRRHEAVSMPSPETQLVSPAIPPSVLAQFEECRDKLPLALRRVFDLMNAEEKPPGGMGREAWAASVLDKTTAQVGEMYDAACDAIARCLR